MVASTSGALNLPATAATNPAEASEAPAETAETTETASAEYLHAGAVHAHVSGRAVHRATTAPVWPLIHVTDRQEMATGAQARHPLGFRPQGWYQGHFAVVCDPPNADTPATYAKSAQFKLRVPEFLFRVGDS